MRPILPLCRAEGESMEYHCPTAEHVGINTGGRNRLHSKPSHGRISLDYAMKLRGICCPTLRGDSSSILQRERCFVGVLIIEGIVFGRLCGHNCNAQLKYGQIGAWTLYPRKPESP
jgi:hypothetical protein